MPQIPVSHQQRITRTAITSGSAVLFLAGLVAIGFSIRGLIELDTAMTMAASATIAAGLALFVQGVTVLWRWDRAIHIVGRERIDVVGMCSEIAGGLACSALAALVLRGDPAAPELLAVATIILGVALGLGGRAQADLAELAPAAPSPWQLRHEPERASTAFMGAVGVAVAAAGIAMLTSDRMMPIVVAIPCAAAAIAFAGGSLLFRFARRVA